MSLFEQATRQKLRFQIPGIGGVYSVEDLWDLPLSAATGKKSLDSLAIALFHEVKKADPVSFVDSEATSNDADIGRLKFDVVKYIIDVKKAERKRQQELSAARREDQAILAIIADKQRAELANLPIEELRKRLSTTSKEAEPA